MALTTDYVTDVAKSAVEYLSETIDVQAAYLFGSYVYGEPHEYSDIDLAVFSADVEQMSLDEKSSLSSKVRGDCDRRLELHLYPASALKKARKTNFYGYILEHGRRIR